MDKKKRKELRLTTTKQAPSAMTPEQLKKLATRLVAEGLHKAKILNGQALREKQAARVMPGPDAFFQRAAANNKQRRAERIRQLCRPAGRRPWDRPHRLRPCQSKPAGVRCPGRKMRTSREAISHNAIGG